MDEPSCNVSYQNHTIPFPTGTSLDVVRQAFNFSGGFLKCKDRPQFITVPNQTLKEGEYELVIIGPGYRPDSTPSSPHEVYDLNDLSQHLVPDSFTLTVPGTENRSGRTRAAAKSIAKSAPGTQAPVLVDPNSPIYRTSNVKRRMTQIPSLHAYEQDLAEHDVQLSSHSISISNALRALVSKKKKRFVNNKFNLDLAYITDRIIAMGFPAKDVEGLYRNSRKDVVKFLETTHGDHYKVWNLCKEPAYQYESSVFNGRVSCIPFWDHNAPSLHQILQFCQEATEWLDKDEENIVAVHCKAGKGRTGLMICALLCYRYPDKFDVDVALEFYSVRRTEDQKGVTIPSQKRFVGYLDKIIKMKDSATFISTLKTTTLCLTSIHLSSAPKFGTDRSFKISWGAGAEEHTFDSSVTKTFDQKTEKGGATEVTNLELKLFREVKVEFFASKETGKEQFFYCWFHCSFGSPPRIEFSLSELDGKAKSKKFQSYFAEDFKLVLEFK